MFERWMLICGACAVFENSHFCSHFGTAPHSPKDKGTIHATRRILLPQPEYTDAPLSFRPAGLRHLLDCPEYQMSVYYPHLIFSPLFLFTLTLLVPFCTVGERG